LLLPETSSESSQLWLDYEDPNLLVSSASCCR
jgi:hypothetical protein